MFSKTIQNLSLTKEKSFTKFNEDFYNTFTDLSIFNCSDFNAVKIVLTGLKVNYVSKGKHRLFLFLPEKVISFYFFLKRLLIRSSADILKNKFFLMKERFKNTPFVIIDDCVFNPHVIHNGDKKLKYFGCLTDGFKKDDFFIIQAQNFNEDFDCNLNEIKNLFIDLPLNSKEKEIIRELKKLYNRLRRSAAISENDFKNIKIALQDFFIQYRLYYRFFENFKARVAFFNMHYHREGSMLAFKQLGIKTIELQHGIISPSDIFYIFPQQIEKVREKSFFPDYIVTFGAYWSNQLWKGFEFNKEQVVEAGYSIYDQDLDKKKIDSLTKLFKNKKIILITTQTFMQDVFIDYVLFLSKHTSFDSSNYSIVVKIHPSEKMDNYQKILNHEEKGIFVTREPLEYLFQLAFVNISVYSTTLYDGLRYGIQGYSIYLPEYKDYIDTIIEDKVAKKLMPKEFPYEIFNTTPNNLEIEYFFKKFDNKVIETIFK